MFSFNMVDYPMVILTLKILRLANCPEFAGLTQGNILVPVFPPAVWTQNGGFNHFDDMWGSGQTYTTHKHQQELSEKVNNEQKIPLKPSCQLAFTR